jgi:hypothetical protein
MIGAFNAVYGALKSFLSAGFWFASFLPTALVLLIHAIIAGHVFDLSFSAVFTTAGQGLFSGDLKDGTLIVVATVALAYLLAPLLPLFRGILDGTLLPEWLHQFLRMRRQEAARAMERRDSRLLEDRATLADLLADYDDAAGKVRTAHAEAVKLLSATGESEYKAARTALTALARAQSSAGLLAPAAEAAQTAILACLAKNNADGAALKTLNVKATAAEVELANKTAKLGGDFQALLAETTQEAAYRHELFRSRNRLLRAADHLSATRIGDARFVVERYAQDVYSVDFDFLWPRLLVAIKASNASDPILESIEAARTRIDFAVTALFLAATIPLIWLPTLVALHGSPRLFVLIGVASPVVIRFLYELILEGQLAFGDIAVTAIDRSRFLVIDMLRLVPPQTRTEERALWQSVRNAEQDGRINDLIYNLPKQPRG